MHVLGQAPVDRAGRPDLPETEFQQQDRTWNIFFCKKNYFEVKITKYHDRRNIHDLTMIYNFVKLGVMYISQVMKNLETKSLKHENL